MKKTILTFIVLILLSCTEGTKMKSNKEVTFPVGFQPISFLSGYFEGKNKQWLYFTDPTTTRQIKFFDLEGNIKDSVSLKAVVEQYPNLTDIHVFSLDTIVVTSWYINKISVINKKGEIWKEFKWHNKVIDKNENEYWLWGSLNPSQQDKESILYRVEWRSNLTDKLKGKVPSELENYRNYFRERTYDSNFFVHITDLFSETPDLNFSIS